MREFPKWLLAMAFAGLASLLTCPFYLFGNLALLGRSEYAIVNFIYYILQNLIWAVPVLLFFAGLQLHFIGMKRAGVAVICVELLLTVLSFVLLL